MEISCPECDQAFVLPDDAVPPAGRRMKCSKCAHVWHQPGTGALGDAAAGEDTAAASVDGSAAGTDAADNGEAADQAAAGPEGAAATSETSTDAETGNEAGNEAGPDAPALPPDDMADTGDFSALRARRRPPPPPPPVRPSGFYATVALTVILALGAVFGRATLVQLWPPAALLYARVGLPVPVVGAGLALREVAAVQGQQGAVPVAMVRGQIVNESQRVVTVPALAAILGDNEGATWDDILFNVDVAVLLPGETVDFQYELPLPSKNVSRVTVTFSRDRPETGGLGY